MLFEKGINHLVWDSPAASAANIYKQIPSPGDRAGCEHSLPKESAAVAAHQSSEKTSKKWYGEPLDIERLMVMGIMLTYTLQGVCYSTLHCNGTLTHKTNVLSL